MTEREQWLMNFYRNSELHGALLMGRLARTLRDDRLLAEATRHCATEARHATMLGDAIREAGGRLDPHVAPVQQHYSEAGGIPKALVDLFVLSETLEHRVLTTYRDHLAADDVDPIVRRTLGAILAEMEHAHGVEHAGWIEDALRSFPTAEVDAAEERWRAVDRRVTAELTAALEGRFPSGGRTAPAPARDA